MDVVIPLGKSSKWQNREIKYSIRSYLKHSVEPIDKFYIIGEKPTFFEYTDKVVHIPFKETQVKEVNIWEKVLRACNEESISEEFFFSNDDYFFMNDFVMSEFPFYHKGDLADYDFTKKLHHQINNPYHFMARKTYDVLKKNKFSTWFFDIHYPIRYEKSKFKEAYEFFQKFLYKGNGLIISSCYGNYHNLEPTFTEDVKFTRADLDKLYTSYKDYLMVSTSDDICCPGLQSFFEEIYPEKPPFEI